MPPRGVKSPTRKRQYSHIKQSERKRGRSMSTAKRIAAATVNKYRRVTGQTRSSKMARRSTGRKRSTTRRRARR